MPMIYVSDDDYEFLKRLVQEGYFSSEGAIIGFILDVLKSVYEKYKREGRDFSEFLEKLSQYLTET